MPVVVSTVPKWRFDTSEVVVPSEWTVIFCNPANEMELAAACREADCLLVLASFPEVTASVLQQLRSVKLIQAVGAGYDRIDGKAAAKLGIPVANVPGANAQTVAEFTVGSIIALQRQLLVADRETKAGRYSDIRRSLLTTGLQEIAGSTVGLIGLGAIGRQTAKILRFLGAAVYYYGRSRQSAALEAELGIQYRSMPKLLTQSDIVSVHVPLNDQTRGLIGHAQMSLMKQGSLLINTARGEVIDELALAEMLEAGRLAGAAVDVTYPEPPPADHPLLTLSPGARERLLITPHIAGVTVGSFRCMLMQALQNIDRVLHQEVPRNVVNGL